MKYNLIPFCPNSMAVPRLFPCVKAEETNLWERVGGTAGRAISGEDRDSWSGSHIEIRMTSSLSRLSKGVVVANLKSGNSSKIANVGNSLSAFAGPRSEFQNFRLHALMPKATRFWILDPCKRSDYSILNRGFVLEI